MEDVPLREANSGAITAPAHSQSPPGSGWGLELKVLRAPADLSTLSRTGVPKPLSKMQWAGFPQGVTELVSVGPPDSPAGAADRHWGPRP